MMASKTVTIVLELLFEASCLPRKAIQKILSKTLYSYHSFSNRFNRNIQVVCCLIFLTSPMCYRIMEMGIICPAGCDRSEISEIVEESCDMQNLGKN